MIYTHIYNKEYKGTKYILDAENSIKSFVLNSKDMQIRLLNQLEANIW